MNLWDYWRDAVYALHKRNYEIARDNAPGTISIDEFMTDEERKYQNWHALEAVHVGIPVYKYDYLKIEGSGIEVYRPKLSGKTEVLRYDRFSGKLIHRGKPEFLIHSARST